MKDLLVAVGLIAVGILTVLFRDRFRFDGPAGVAPLFDKAPTGKAEQRIVAVFGIVIACAGAYLLIKSTGPSFFG